MGKGKSGLALCLCGVFLWLVGCDRSGGAAGAAGTAEAAPAGEKGTVLELTDATFDAVIAQGVVLVDFWAPWCGPCRTQGPLVEQAAALLGETAKVAKVNVDQAPEAAKKFGVRSIPTLVVFKDGQPGKRFVGVTQPAVLVEAVQAAIN